MTGPLIERLPAVRGDYGEAVPMARHTWFGVGGHSEGGGGSSERAALSSGGGS